MFVGNEKAVQEEYDDGVENVTIANAEFDRDKTPLAGPRFTVRR